MDAIKKEIHQKVLDEIAEINRVTDPLLSALVSFGVSTTTIAEALGVSRPAISAFLHGTKPFPRKHIPKIIQFIMMAIAEATDIINDIEGGGYYFKLMHKVIEEKYPENGLEDGFEREAIRAMPVGLSKRIVDELKSNIVGAKGAISAYTLLSMERKTQDKAHEALVKALMELQ